MTPIGTKNSLQKLFIIRKTNKNSMTTEEEDFQFVLSREDYKRLDQYRNKYEEACEQRQQMEKNHSQDTSKYLTKIQKLEKDLKTYQQCLKSHMKEELSRVDELLTQLKDYRKKVQKTFIDDSLLNSITDEENKISSKFNIEIQDFQQLNQHMQMVMKKLIQDSKQMKQQMDYYRSQYEQIKEGTDYNLLKITSLNEKIVGQGKQLERMGKEVEQLQTQNEQLKRKLDSEIDRSQRNDQEKEQMKKEFDSKLQMLGRKQKDIEKQHRQHQNVLTAKHESELTKERKEKQQLKQKLSRRLQQLQEQYRQSLITRDSQRQQLNKQLQDSELKRSSLQNLIERNQNQIEELSMQLEEQRLRIKSLEQDFDELKRENLFLKETNEIDVFRFKEKQKTLQMTLQTQEKELKECVAKRDCYVLEVKQLKKEIQMLKKQLQQVKIDSQNNRQESAAQKEQNHSLKTKNSQLQEKCQAYSNQIQRLVRQMDDLNQMLDECESKKQMQVSSFEAAIAEKEKHIQNIQTKLSQQIQKQSKSDQSLRRLNKLQTENQELKKHIARIEGDKNNMQQERTFLEDDIHSMREYIEELERNLQALERQKHALSNELTLTQQEIDYSKNKNQDLHEKISSLERDLEEKISQLAESTKPTSIVKRSSLSKGEKSYYVKEMIMEYGNEMKKNLLQIGALSHDEIKELIVSQLRELGNYVRKIEDNFD